MDGTLRGRVPVALGRCLHPTVFVRMLQRDKEDNKHVHESSTFLFVLLFEKGKPHCSLLVWTWTVSVVNGWGRTAGGGSLSWWLRRAEVWRWQSACERRDPLGHRGRGWWERREGDGNHEATYTWGGRQTGNTTNPHLVRSHSTDLLFLYTVQFAHKLLSGFSFAHPLCISTNHTTVSNTVHGELFTWC